jgi:hypothetical protein
VVRLRGRVVPEPDDVGLAPRVGAQQVVHLLARELPQPGRAHQRVAAHDLLPRAQQDVAVGDEEEGRAGHVLRVGAVAEVDQAARCNEHLVERRVRDHGAHVVVRLRLKALRAARPSTPDVSSPCTATSPPRAARPAHALQRFVSWLFKLRLMRRITADGTYVVAGVGAVEGALAVVAAAVVLREQEQLLLFFAR